MIKGIGETIDFEVYISWDGRWLPNYTGMGVNIRFSAPFSGYYVRPACLDSLFTGPYFAETNNVQFFLEV